MKLHRMVGGKFIEYSKWHKGNFSRSNREGQKILEKRERDVLYQ